MKLFQATVAMAGLLAAMLMITTPAQALKSLQYRAQGHGRYLNSNGTPKHYSHGYGLFSRHHHRHRRYRGY